MSHVERLRRHYFWQPDRMQKIIVIRVPHLDFDPMEHKGSLGSPSPEEIVHAFLKAIAEDIEAAKPDEHLKLWKQAALSVSFSFELMETDSDVYWKSVNLSEDLVTDYAEMSRSGLQKVIEIVNFKKNMKATMGNLSAEKVAQLYAENARVSENSEAMSDSMVDCCLTVYSRALKHEAIYKNIVKCEDRWGVGSPWHKVLKIHAVVTRARSLENITWVMNAIYDAMMRDLVKPDACSKRGLVGKRAAVASSISSWQRRT